MGKTEKLGPLLERKLEREEGDPPVIIRLKEGRVTSQAVSILSRTGIEITGQERQLGLVFANATEKEIDRLQDLGIIEQVEFDAPVSAQQEDGGNFFSSQILPALDATAAASKRTITQAKQQINADVLNEKGLTGNGVNVAVLDTGVRKSHPALQGQVTKEFQLAPGNLHDQVGHGTWIAGCVAAKGVNVNGKFLEGVAPDANIFNVKVLNDQGVGRISNIIAGASRAAEAGADVINLSLGLPTPCAVNSTICTALTNIAADFNVIMAGAAGNRGPETSPHLPAQCQSMIAVGSVTAEGEPSRFSSRGPVCENTLYPGIAAPGGSTDSGIISSFPGGTRALRGTSMATPFVAGTLALMREKVPGVTTRTASNALFQTATRADNPNMAVGHGVVRAQAAVEQVASPERGGQPVQIPENAASIAVPAATAAGLFFLPTNLNL